MKIQVIRLTVAIAVAALTSLPLVAADSAPCARLVSDTATPEDMSIAWLTSFQAFVESNDELSPQQRSVIAHAVKLGTAKTFAVRTHSEHGLVLPELAELIRKAKGAFSADQLGEIFSRMGPTQRYLLSVAELGEPFCNCKGVGNTCTYNGGPSGTCETGCVSWTKEETNEHYVAICSSDGQDDPGVN